MSGYGVKVEWYVEAGMPPEVEAMRKEIALEHLWLLIKQHALNAKEVPDGDGKRGWVWVTCEPKETP